MGLATGKTFQDSHLNALAKLGLIADSNLQLIIDKLDLNQEASLRLHSSFPTADAKLVIEASKHEVSNGAEKSAPALSNSVLDFPVTTIDFQTGAIVGGTVTITLPSSTIG